MQRFISKVLILLSILANFALFLVTVTIIIFVFVSTNALQEIIYYINYPITIAGVIFSSASVIYSIAISILALVYLIKGNGLRNIVANYCAFFPILIAAGIIVFGFGNLNGLYFNLFLEIYIATAILNILLLLASIIITTKEKTL